MTLSGKERERDVQSVVFQEELPLGIVTERRGHAVAQLLRLQRLRLLHTYTERVFPWQNESELP